MSGRPCQRPGGGGFGEKFLGFLYLPVWQLRRERIPAQGGDGDRPKVRSNPGTVSLFLVMVTVSRAVIRVVRGHRRLHEAS